MKEQYLVSIIIPVYNGSRFLKQAIESVFSQTYSNIEIIVIDDGSTDKTREIATSFSSVIYQYQENKGVASARNKALAIANGEFIAFLDADDFYPEDKLKNQIDFLVENPTIGFCIGHQNNFIELGYSISEIDYDYFINHEKVGLPTIVTHKSVYEKVGFYNENLQTESDYEWVVRANDEGIKFRILPNILLNRRIHNTNLTLGARKSTKVLLFQILKESMDRKRKQGL